MDSTREIVLEHFSNGPVREPQQPGEEQIGRQRPEFSLPQADGGKDAWLFLAACFTVEALVWGFPFSFGVFQEYYTTHEPFSAEPSEIPLIGTTAMGIMYMIGMLFFPAYKKWPWLANVSKWAGVPLMAASLVAGSFATKVSHLIITQGALYAIGGSIVYCPALTFVDEWFVHRKGLAFGVMWVSLDSSLTVG